MSNRNRVVYLKINTVVFMMIIIVYYDCRSFFFTIAVVLNYHHCHCHYHCYYRSLARRKSEEWGPLWDKSEKGGASSGSALSLSVSRPQKTKKTSEQLRWRFAAWKHHHQKVMNVSGIWRFLFIVDRYLQCFYIVFNVMLSIAFNFHYDSIVFHRQTRNRNRSNYE